MTDLKTPEPKVPVIITVMGGNVIQIRLANAHFRLKTPILGEAEKFGSTEEDSDHRLIYWLYVWVDMYDKTEVAEYLRNFVNRIQEKTQ